MIMNVLERWNDQNPPSVRDKALYRFDCKNKNWNIVFVFANVTAYLILTPHKMWEFIEMGR